MIQLWTLGRLDLRSADGTELRVILTQPKRVALLAYLALHNPRGFISREHLLALFWPEQDTEHARSALNRALYFLRRSLGREVILSRGDGEVGLSWDHLWCDAVAFERAASSGAARDAVALYRGDLLRGFHVSDAHGVDEWLDSERERMRRLAQRAGWSLAEQEERAGNFAAAAQAARWAAQRAPYDEAGVQRLIALLDRSGDRAGAIQVYDEFERLLHDELEVEPAPETRALIDAIRARQRQNGLHAPAETVHSAPATVEQRVETPAAPRTSRWSLKQSAVAAAAALVVIVGGTALLVRPRSDPHVVLISALENRTGDATLDVAAQHATEWIVRSVTDAVESTTSPVFRQGNRVVRGNMRVGVAGIRVSGGAGIRVAGELYREGGQIVFRVRLIDEVHGGSVWSVPPIQARADSVEDALREVAQRATGGVAALLNEGLARWFPVASNPPTYEAFAEMLRTFQIVPFWKSAPGWERTAALDTTFTYALLQVARYVRPNDPLRSDEILRILAGKRERLTRVQGFLLDAMLAEFAENRTATYEAYRGAANLAPVRYLYDFAMSAYGLYRPRETLRLLDRWEQLNPRNVGQVSMRFELYHQLGEHRRELVLASKARQSHPNQLDALYAYVRALAALRRTAEVTALLDSALSAPRDHSYTPGSIMQIASEELRAHGEPGAAAVIARQMLDWYERNPATEIDTTWHSFNLANAYYVNGKWNESKAIYNRIADAQPTFRAQIYGYVGANAARANDRTTALHYIALLDSLNVPAEGPRYEALISRARITALLGDADETLHALRNAVGGQGMDLHADEDFAALMNNPAFREFCRPKD